MITATICTLSGVLIGALIFWWAIRTRVSLASQPGGYVPAAPPMPDHSQRISAQIANIRRLIRSANQDSNPDAAAQALAMLNHLEATYGTAAVARVCDAQKLRGIIARVQSRAAALPAA